MRKIIIMCLGFLLFSCASQKTTLSPFIIAYKSDWIGNIYPEYIVLRTRPKVFEIYAPGVDESVFGEWKINNDTLCLFPQHECFSRNYELKISEITPRDSSVISIDRQYLIKNNCLIDITDYNIVLQGFISNQDNKPLFSNQDNKPLFRNQDNKIVYKKITNQ